MFAMMGLLGWVATLNGTAQPAGALCYFAVVWVLIFVSPKFSADLSSNRAHAVVHSTSDV